jgi:hypothetical protein
MLPPLFLPDHRVGPSPRPFEERSSLRRGAPERLRIEPVSPQEPRVTLAALGPPPEPRARGGWLPRLRLTRGAATT